MKKYKKAFKQIILGMLIATVCFGAFHLVAKKQDEPKIISDLITQQLKSVSELTTLEYYYTNIGKFENNIDFNGWNIPLTTKEFVLSYDGIIKAGINLDDLNIEIKGDKIIIQLPEAKIVSHVIQEDSIQLFNESKNIFNPISISDYVNFTKALKEEKETDLQTKGFLVEAKEKSKQILMTLISSMNSEKYTVEFID